MLNSLASVVSGVSDALSGKPAPFKRSSQWPLFRRSYLALNPTCAACGSNKNLEIHHIKPFHLHPDSELDPNNLITLCEGAGCNCHITFGHLLNWKSWNPGVIYDAQAFYLSVKHRPNPNNQSFSPGSSHGSDKP